jgi:hypothetical protein
MKEYEVKIEGLTGLLLHNDNIDWADLMTRWQKDPENKGKSKAGDDRTPPWRWIGSLYHDGEHVVVPTDNIAVALRAGAVQIPMDGKKTYKEASQTCIFFPGDSWPIYANGQLVSWDEIVKLQNNNISFAEQCEAAKALGFTLSVKRARVGQSKHIRVRPRFDNWVMIGTVKVDD